MPNWNCNDVAIHAPREAVKAWLVPQQDDTYLFNMHLLFPETFSADDQSGEAHWDYDWAVDNTGSKWFPAVEIDNIDDEEPTLLHYDTARAPNNLTLRQLHKLTGWAIVNQYEEPGEGFEGTFTCDEHGVTDEERQYQPRCQNCDQKQPVDEYTLDDDHCVCNTCRKNAPIS